MEQSSYKPDTAFVELLTKKVEKSKPAYLKTLESLVKIDTTTGNKEGSKSIANYIKGRLEAVGGNVVFHPSDAGIHVVARFYGDGNKKILIYDHTDTVTDDAVNNYAYDRVRDMVRGQGAADSKGSVAFLIEMLSVMNALNIAPYKELILYFDCEEEVGSEIQERLIMKLASEADFAFVADTGRPDLGIVTKRKATGDYTATIEGIAGHAGNGPHATANALTEAGFIITKLYRLQSTLPDNPYDYNPSKMKEDGIVDRGQFIPDNVINVSMISTNNKKSNIVPDNATIHFNLRCYSQDEFIRLEKEIFALENEAHRKGIKVKIEGVQSYKPLEAVGASKKLADIYKSVGRLLLKREIPEFVAGGVTPSNIIINSIPVIDSVGIDSDPTFEHSRIEELDVGAYIPRTILAIEFFKAVDSVDLN